jgi:hypothetical protein
MKWRGFGRLEKILEQVGQETDLPDPGRGEIDPRKDERFPIIGLGNLLECEETVERHEVPAEAVRHPGRMRQPDTEIDDARLGRRPADKARGIGQTVAVVEEHTLSGDERRVSWIRRNGVEHCRPPFM